MSEEWGPWIEHDGKGCPVAAGVVVMIQDVFGEVKVWASEGKGVSWEITEPMLVPTSYGFHLATPIVRYRVRKPLGLTILESLLSDLPETVDV